MKKYVKINDALNDDPLYLAALREWNKIRADFGIRPQEPLAGVFACSLEPGNSYRDPKTGCARWDYSGLRVEMGARLDAVPEFQTFFQTYAVEG